MARTDGGLERSWRLEDWPGADPSAHGPTVRSMTGLEQFIASLVHSLAWPAAVIVPAVVFRKQIGGLLDSPMRRLRAGPVEVEFERVFARVEADVPIDTPPSERESGVTSELSELAKRVPSAAILEAFSRVEHRLRELLQADGETPAPLG